MSNNKILNIIYALTACGIGSFFVWDKFFAFHKTNTGLEYKYIKHGDDKSDCKDDQFIFFEKIISYKNVILYNSNDNPDFPLAIAAAELKKLNFDGEQFEALNLLKKKGDECVFKIKIDKLIKNEDIPVVNQKFKINLNENSLLDLKLKINDFINSDQIFDAIQEYRKKKKEELEKNNKIQMVKDIEIIEKYLKSNKIDNVKKTESGLHYVIKTSGEGEVPQNGDTLLVDYVGKDLLTGKIFDSSIESVAKEANIFHEQRTYEPMRFVWSKNPGFIPGFAEGLALLNKGCEASLFIPSVLAYGPQGIPGIIEKNANLIFEVKIIDIIKEEGKKAESEAEVKK